ncbi:PREDICTED: calcitonin gene-related peptide type 1 receptor-like [Rhagoletis zephyria]|uniref:calcitonin gene-related peptide type 1 receptor-like n=1 Tax=Rhagoletis zephyria TaxID=28612 RepID=UPI00081181CF|nr:PREDICTED: calcitonin gene-related peptide type 1 receptor-like [Rhagoletis zephyria]XP_017485487.1 PREDICTED: calcitonin gene-related peptide type 1 receptor-like [Rhagoletis zephyria]
MNILSGKSQLLAHTLCIAGLTAATSAATHTHNADNLLAAPTTATATSNTLTLAARMLAGLPTSAAIVDPAKADVAPVDGVGGGGVRNVARAENESAAETQPDSFEVLRNECYERLNSTTTKFAAGELYCAGTFDGWLCWPDTAAGTSAYERCPEFIFGFDPTRNAHKECGRDGEWYKHPVWNYSWTNYTSCVNIDDLEWKHSINIFYETGYGISLVAILLSLAILSYFKSLKCARITLHMNLFTSFAANNSLWLIWYLVVVPDTELLQKSPPTCIALHIILHYFLLTNYAWMLCEGFYLHTVLVSAFISEKKLVKWLIAFGWGSPAIVIFIYGLARGLGGTGDEITHCWMNSTPFDYIFVVPVCISMFLNLLFLCNIVRVVLLKLKAPASIQNSCGPSRTVLQAFRATLLLVPLLGLQYILTPFRPEPNHPWEHTYEVISAFTASFQGLCVATFFCFFNGEVIAQVKRKWRMVCFSNRARANSYTATQVSVRFCWLCMSFRLLLL